jgi:hypothetical protein
MFELRGESPQSIVDSEVDSEVAYEEHRVGLERWPLQSMIDSEKLRETQRRAEAPQLDYGGFEGGSCYRCDLPAV